MASFIYKWSFLEENLVIRNISLILRVLNLALRVERVLLIISLARGCSVVENVTGLSQETLLPPTTI